jgi:Tesmin/TSO1-like CXC domain, cysteine-rich domain
MVAQEQKSAKTEGGSSSASRGTGHREEKAVRAAASEPSGRNNCSNTASAVTGASAMPVSYPPPPPHHAMHYFPPYPPPYDHTRVSAVAPPSNGEPGLVARGLPMAGPYTSAQVDRLKLPQPAMVPSHYAGAAATHGGNPTLPPPANGPAPMGKKSSPPSAAGKKKNNINAQSTKTKNLSTGPPPSQSNPPRDPPPPMPHHFHHPSSKHMGPPPPHHYPGYPPPPRDDHAHHHRAWAEYHSHYFDPASGAPYPPPPPGSYLPPPPKQPDGGASTGGPYRFSDTTLRRDALSQLKNANVSPHSQQYRRAMELSDPDLDREGATSPSQIESSHRDEVTTMGCTCKKTKCLKLYCQCFAVKIYCGVNCRCTVCQNTESHEKERQGAIRSILSRNPQAFDTKFKKSVPELSAVELAHKLGCKCRKSSCMKKYCECYAGGVRCTESCRCVGCKNTGRGAPGAGEALAKDAGPLAPTLFAAIAAQATEEPLRKREPYMMDAAHNLVSGQSSKDFTTEFSRCCSCHLSLLFTQGLFKARLSSGKEDGPTSNPITRWRVVHTLPYLIRAFTQ